MKFLIAMSLLMALLNSWANNPDSKPIERTVSATGFYTLAGGVATSSICAVIVNVVRAVEPGNELDACSPYGLLGSGVAARLHLYWINGYGPDEWEYVRGVPSRTVKYVLGGFGGLTSGGSGSEGEADVRETVREQVKEL